MAEWDYAGLAGMDDFEELNQEPASFGSSYKEKEPSLLENIKRLEERKRKYLALINEYKKILDIRTGHEHFKVSYENSMMLEKRKNIDFGTFDYVMYQNIRVALKEILRKSELEYAAVNKKLEAVKEALK